MDASIIYTWTDEAPALATYSLLPAISKMLAAAGIPVETRDISLAGRILAAFPECLKPEQRVSDDLAELGRLVHDPNANIIKLPNISASVPQLSAAIAELQAHGFAVPDYPSSPTDDRETDIRRRYDAIKGSAVNPVLREGNSDRRSARSVKNYARANPHSMGVWAADSKTRVASMTHGDYFETERSTTVRHDGSVQIRFVPRNNAGPVVLREAIPTEAGDVLDAAVLSKQALRSFVATEIEAAKRDGVLFSVHLKATMMKVSDPVIFGHVLSVFFEQEFNRHAEALAEVGFRPNNGLGDLYARIESLSPAVQEAIRTDVSARLATGPDLYMVDSDRGITNFHVPSDVIIDASLPAAIRAGGKGWDADGNARDAVFVIPDRTYAGVYQAVIDDCKENGAYDPRVLGSVSNVGLMAQKAEEYGSHDKTFEIEGNGTVQVIDAQGSVLLERDVEAGDLFRVCQVKDVAVQDWVGLALRRARETNTPVVFWLDAQRAHDEQLITKVNQFINASEAAGVDIRILAPADATRFSTERMRSGLDTISATGNVLRDYLTDLFPIIELGTSAKMLSIVPLLNGGGLFETGAGGSAPKHVQQFVEEGYLRWDSLGEFLALSVSLEHFARTTGNPHAQAIGQALDTATERLLTEGRSPARKVGAIDNRGSHFYLTMFWARAIADSLDAGDLKDAFAALAGALEANEATIANELIQAQGAPVDIGGYYHPDRAKATAAMNPSPTLARIMGQF